MSNLSDEYRTFAGQLAGGPAFLLLGQAAGELPGEAVRSHAWNGVYTSDIRREIADSFITDWRTSTSHGAIGSAPSRSTTDLEVRYLFGADHLPETDRPASN